MSNRIRTWMIVATALFVSAMVVTVPAVARADGDEYAYVESGSDGPYDAATVDGQYVSPGQQPDGSYYEAGTSSETYDPSLEQSPSYGTSAPDSMSSSTTSTTGPCLMSGDAGTNWRAGKTWYGKTVWKIWNHTHWCWDGTRVTRVAGWTDIYTGVGWSASDKRWGWGWWDLPTAAHTQSSVHFFLGWQGQPVQEANPTVNTFVDKDGYYWFG